MRVDVTDLKSIRVFMSVVENHGFVGAQLELNISPSAVSTHIKSLEDRLGLVLCHRGKRGFRLTKDGEQLNDACKTLTAALDGFETRMSDLRNDLTGTLRLGLATNMVTDPAFSIHEVIRRFSARGDGIFINIQTTTPDVLERELIRNTLQLAITPVYSQIDLLAYRPLYHESHSIYCGHGHDLFGKTEADLMDLNLSNFQFVTRTYINQKDVANLPNLRRAASVSNMEAQLMLILSGAYMGYLADHFTKDWVEKGALWRVPITTSSQTVPVCVVLRRNQPTSRLVDAFLQDIKL